MDRKMKRLAVENECLNILNLPEGVLEKILQQVGASSLRDLCKLRVASKIFYQISTSQIFFRTVDTFSKDNEPQWWADEFEDAKIQWYRDCFMANNPKSKYLKGSQDYILRLNKEGLNLIKASANDGVEMAIYTYGMLLKFVLEKHEEGEEYLGRLSRETVRRVSLEMEKVGQTNWPFFDEVPAELQEKINSFDCQELYSCKCVEYVRWCRHYEYGFKGPNLCTKCFWTLEAVRFFKYFPDSIAKWPDMSDW